MPVIRFDFDDSPEGIKKFFSEELPELLETVAFFIVSGSEVERIDLEKRKIYLKPIPDITQPTIENEVPVSNNDVVETKLCSNCTHFSAKGQDVPGYCNLNFYSTLATDTCKLWKKGN